MGTALLQRGGCFLLCLSLLLLGCWAELGSGLEFPGAEGQWTRFPKWNACCESEMSFQLKTRSARGLVLYFDDEGFCDFLELILTRGGRLQLSFSIFCAEPATLLADTPVNDGAWHNVRIRRQFRNTTLFIDQVEAKWVEVKSKRRDMTVFSGLFVGGLPPELRAAALKLTLASVREREPFKGWIRDVRVNSSQAVPVDSGEVKLEDEPPNSGGGSPCEAGEEGEGGVCLNGGVCSVVDDQAVCDCSRTGFRGKDCSQGKALHLNPWGLDLGRARGGRARQAGASWCMGASFSGRCVLVSLEVKTCFWPLCFITSYSSSLGILLMVEQFISCVDFFLGLLSSNPYSFQVASKMTFPLHSLGSLPSCSLSSLGCDPPD